MPTAVHNYHTTREKVISSCARLRWRPNHWLEPFLPALAVGGDHNSIITVSVSFDILTFRGIALAHDHHQTSSRGHLSSKVNGKVLELVFTLLLDNVTACQLHRTDIFPTLRQQLTVLKRPFFSFTVPNQCIKTEHLSLYILVPEKGWFGQPK